MPEFNALNPDMADPRYNTGISWYLFVWVLCPRIWLYSVSDLGIYEEGCGLDNVEFAYGHDEYLYKMLVRSVFCIIRLPIICSLYIFSFHRLPINVPSRLKLWRWPAFTRCTLGILEVPTVTSWMKRITRCWSGYLSLINLICTRRMSMVCTKIPSKSSGLIIKGWLINICPESWNGSLACVVNMRYWSHPIPPVWNKESILFFDSILVKGHTSRR